MPKNVVIPGKTEIIDFRNFFDQVQWLVDNGATAEDIGTHVLQNRDLWIETWYSILHEAHRHAPEERTTESRPDNEYWGKRILTQKEADEHFAAMGSADGE